MSRRRKADKRVVIPDAEYRNELVSRFISCVMRDGKRSVAEGIVYGAMTAASSKLRRDPLEMFYDLMKNVEPAVEVCSRRMGGATYQVPVEVRPLRRRALALRWLVAGARKRNEKTMIERLAGELVDAYNNRGAAVKKKEESHKMAEANKAFSHYRW